MPSAARIAFTKNAEDIKRLLEIHGDLGGDAPGRRHRLGVLNKSAIVLVTSFWEAYCEDIAAEAVKKIATCAPSASKLSKDIKKIIAKELKGDLNEIAIWSLADDGWKTVLGDRLTRLQDERNRRLNTPKSQQIDELFAHSIGLPNISSAWAWKGMSADRAREKLDRYVALRGEIAHRGAGAQVCKRHQVADYFAFIKRIIAKTGGRVNRHVKKITGSGLW